MSDLTRYRMLTRDEFKQDHNKHDYMGHQYDFDSLTLGGVLVPDDTLQQIADAWQRYKETQESVDLDKAMDLLDALVEDNDDAEKPTPCEFGDLTCPCQDGGPCHYEGENPMAPRQND